MTSNIKNNVNLIGNVGMDIQLTSFDSGSKKASITLATNDYYTNNQGEKVKNTEWHNLVAWGKTAEIMAKNIKKGAEVAIQGKLTSRSYTDKLGSTRYITEIVVNEFYLMQKSTKAEVA
jgi:single-strand DNA-binding protein